MFETLIKNSILKAAGSIFLSLMLLSACGGDSGGGSTPPPPSTIKAVIISSSVAKLNADITISAAGSSSTGTNPLAYDWKVISEPELSSGTIKTPSSRAAKLYATVEGTYKIKLTVSDGTSSDSTEKEIRIDLDGDGVLSGNDDDKDGDGILNKNDVFPEDITEWVDSDKNGVGNYMQPDEDGDGINDEVDDYPFDTNKSVMPAFSEVEFNGNLYPDGNNIGGTYPFKVSGLIEFGATYQVDVDYFLFNASAGDLISIVLRTSANDFNPALSLLDDLGSSLTTVKTNDLGAGVYAVSARIPTSGIYALTVSEMNNKTSSEYSYTIDVFKDSDIDGLSDEKELAMGMISTTPDSDGDGLSDGLEYYMAKNDFDADSDGLPVWWDRDSDNDGIDDLIETAADVDNDGIPNFLDLDSDGNSISDISEFGIDPLTPLDTDRDSILDFVDLDDDADNLLDINDNERLMEAVTARLSDKSNRLILLSAITELASFGKQVRSIARIGDSIIISGEGFGADPLVLWEHAQGVENIKPVATSDTELTFVVPEGVGTGRLKISNGIKISGFLNIKIVESDSPMIFSITTASGNLYATPNEILTIEGTDFSAASLNVSFDGVSQSATIITNSMLQVVVPQDARSGDLVVIGSATSNPIALEIRQGTSGVVELPASSSLALTDLTVEFTGSSESTIASDGSFFLATRNQGPTSITIFSPEKTGHTPAVFLSATVLSGQTQIEMSSLSTAVDLIYSAMGLEASIHKEDQYKAVNILKDAVVEFGRFLDQNLGADPYYLEDYQKSEFVTEYIAAIEDAGKALDAAINSGAIRRAITNNVSVSKQMFRMAKSSTTGNAKVLPKENQEDFVVTLNKVGDTYSGAINIENDTMLFADFKATNAYNGNIVRDYVNGYFSSNLLGPQRGVFALYWGNDINVELKYRSANIIVYTPGLQGMTSWDEYYSSPSYRLAIRTFLSQALVPVVNSVVGVKFGDSTTNKVLNILFTYGAFEGLEIFWTNPSASGFADGIGRVVLKIIDPRQLILEKVVAAVATDLSSKGAQKLAVKLGLKLTPWGSAATAISVAGTAIDLGKLAVDAGTTNGQIRYKVIFPISVESVEPSIIIKDDEPKEIKLQGNGLGPIVRGSIFGDSVHYPSVEFVDRNGNSYIDEKPRYESYLIAPGSTPPRSPLKVTLPVDYLKNAESPLSVILHHYLIDEDLFVDDLVAVNLDTQYEIEIVDKLTISAISPDKGAWGDTVKLSGAGFSEIITDNTVYFTASDGAALAALITSASSTELIVIVPKGSDTGDVWVAVQRSGKTEESNKVLFTLEQQNYTFKFGDNGSLNDDTFALYIDGQHVRTMPAPTRTESVEFPLTSGRHSAELHGITAPDAVGTYYITFPAGITVVSGDSTSGSDLTAGKVKSWVLDVQAVSNRMMKRQAVDMPKIMWKE